jgi:hypothetical protein
MNHDAHEAYDGERKTDGEELGKASQRQTDASRGMRNQSRCCGATHAVSKT